jgi:hypothetical protein
MIKLICGKNGSGKSYNLVKYAVGEMRRGRLVFSDMPIFCIHRGKVLNTAVLTKDMLRNFSFPVGSLIVINEGDSWFYSRDYKSFTSEDLIIFSQSRHIDLDLIIVAKDVGALDLNIRRCADEYTWLTRFPAFDKIRPFFFKLTTYYAESDFLSNTPRIRPSVTFTIFKKKVATCYDTKYQKNILDARPVKEYKMWDMCHYEPRVSLFGKIKAMFIISKNFVRRFVGAASSCFSKNVLHKFKRGGGEKI